MSYFLMYTRYASVYSRVCSASEFHLQPAKQDEWMHALVRVQRIYSPHTTQIRDLSLSFGNAIDATAIKPCIATRRAAATSPKARTPSRTEFERLSDRTFRSNNPKRLRYDPCNTTNKTRHSTQSEMLGSRGVIGMCPGCECHNRTKLAVLIRIPGMYM